MVLFTCSKLYPKGLTARMKIAHGIAKDHPKLAFEICERWLAEASIDTKWMIRHALRHPAKQGVKAALWLRRLAT